MAKNVRIPSASDMSGELDADAACIILEDYYAELGVDAERIQFDNATIAMECKERYKETLEQMENDRKRMMEERERGRNARQEMMERVKREEEEAARSGGDASEVGRKKKKKKKKKKK